MEVGTFNALANIEGTMKNDELMAMESVTSLCECEDSKEARAFLTTVGDKWSFMLVVMLSRTSNKRARFSELQRMLDSFSQRMLTTTLRNLERDGILSREVFPQVPPRVEYELTPLGLSLLGPMHNLVLWIVGNWNSIKKAREKFDTRAR